MNDCPATRRIDSIVVGERLRRDLGHVEAWGAVRRAAE
jgi:hypothetical protein